MVVKQACPFLTASLMCANPLQRGDDVKALEEAGIDGFHVDIMDGHYVSNLALSFDDAHAVVQAATRPVDLHLMVEHPEDYLDLAIASNPAAVAFHPDASSSPERVASRLRQQGIRVGWVVRDSFLYSGVPPIDYFLVMTVEPGFARQPFRSESVMLVRNLCQRFADLPLWVDGAIDEERAYQLWCAGARGFVLGTSGLYRADRSYLDSIKIFRQLLRG